MLGGKTAIGAALVSAHFFLTSYGPSWFPIKHRQLEIPKETLFQAFILSCEHAEKNAIGQIEKIEETLNTQIVIPPFSEIRASQGQRKKELWGQVKKSTFARLLAALYFNCLFSISELGMWSILCKYRSLSSLMKSKDLSVELSGETQKEVASIVKKTLLNGLSSLSDRCLSVVGKLAQNISLNQKFETSDILDLIEQSRLLIESSPKWYLEALSPMGEEKERKEEKEKEKEEEENQVGLVLNEFLNLLSHPGFGEVVRRLMDEAFNITRAHLESSPFEKAAVATLLPKLNKLVHTLMSSPEFYPTTLPLSSLSSLSPSPLSPSLPPSLSPFSFLSNEREEEGEGERRGAIHPQTHFVSCLLSFSEMREFVFEEMFLDIPSDLGLVQDSG